jgi:hypothetical protein
MCKKVIGIMKIGERRVNGRRYQILFLLFMLILNKSWY